MIAYEVLRKEKLVSFPYTKETEKRIDAIVANITGSYFGAEIYPTPELKAVAYLYFLIKDHPFIDGNKRTATLVFEVICTLNELNPNYGKDSLDEIAVYIEETPPQENQETIRLVAKALFEEQ